MKPEEIFVLKSGNVYAMPVLHYSMEFAAEVRRAFLELQPDCIAVELPETMQLYFLHAASRLPDISLVAAEERNRDTLYFMCEPCDPAFEGLRSALDLGLPCHCIDLDVEGYPEVRESLPDPYAIQRIGLKNYYEAYEKSVKNRAFTKTKSDSARELYMGKRLKELSLNYDKILFICGMAHVKEVLEQIERPSYPPLTHAPRNVTGLFTLTEESCREVMHEYAWMTCFYESMRPEGDFPDRQKVIYDLYKNAAPDYSEATGNPFAFYNYGNLMKFSRNYALTTGKLMPDLFQILASAKGCVDHNYAYEVWRLATEYPYRKNVDSLPELNLSVEDVWGHSKSIRFHLRAPSRKSGFPRRRDTEKRRMKFYPPGPFSLCSFPPEDVVVERFGDFLKKKGTQILQEDAGRTIPFLNSIEDGLDIRETIRHWHEHKLYVKVWGKPPGGVGSVVVVFDEDSPSDESFKPEQYPWKMTWMGEHSQESDMAFYSTSPLHNVVGPGISRCEYGGFMMSYPPRRMRDVWNDPDYADCRTKAEVLLMAAIDYAVKPIVVYVAAKPPRSLLKSFAQRYGRKIVYLPIGQLSPTTLNKLRSFHILDGYDKREVAGDYIY